MLGTIKQDMVKKRKEHKTMSFQIARLPEYNCIDLIVGILKRRPDEQLKLQHVRICSFRMEKN